MEDLIELDATDTWQRQPGRGKEGSVTYLKVVFDKSTALILRTSTLQQQSASGSIKLTPFCSNDPASRAQQPAGCLHIRQSHTHQLYILLTVEGPASV